MLNKQAALSWSEVEINNYQDQPAQNHRKVWMGRSLWWSPTLTSCSCKGLFWTSIRLLKALFNQTLKVSMDGDSTLSSDVSVFNSLQKEFAPIPNWDFSC